MLCRETSRNTLIYNYSCACYIFPSMYFKIHVRILIYVDNGKLFPFIDSKLALKGKKKANVKKKPFNWITLRLIMKMKIDHV